jgi:plasmid stability protein
MADILVRNLDETLVQRLKERARRQGRSLQAEVAHILTLAAEAPKLDAQTAQERLAEFRRRFKGRRFSDSAKLIREHRN